MESLQGFVCSSDRNRPCSMGTQSVDVGTLLLLQAQETRDVIERLTYWIGDI